MALEHAHPGQAVSVKPYGTALASATTQALFKSTQLEVVRIVLRKGQHMPSHKVPGEITIQCIEGMVDIVSRRTMVCRRDQPHPADTYSR